MKLYNRHATVESVETPGLKRDVEIRRTAMLDLTPPEINRVVDTLKVAIWRVDIFLENNKYFCSLWLSSGLRWRCSSPPSTASGDTSTTLPSSATWTGGRRQLS